MFDCAIAYKISHMQIIWNLNDLHASKRDGFSVNVLTICDKLQ